MKIPSVKPDRRWLVAAVLLVTLAAAGLVPLAFARIILNTIDPEAVVTDNGRRLIVTGPIQVAPAGEKAFLRVTVTQRLTGAVAEGHAVLTGTGELQEWQVEAEAQGRAAFEEGPATAVAIARSTDRGQVTDAHQWLVNITLVKQ